MQRERLTFNANISGNLTARETSRIDQATALLDRIINSERFKEEILNADFSGETSDWKHKTNLEIYLHIMSGMEVLSPERDNEADISIDVFKPKFWQRSVVGYTYVYTATQWINRNYLAIQSIIKIASNIFHEYGHKLGFDHDFKWTLKRSKSICYQLNLIIEKLHKELKRDPSQSPVGTPEMTPEKRNKRLSLWGRVKRFFFRML